MGLFLLGVLAGIHLWMFIDYTTIPKSKQTTFVHCPRCRFEMVNSNSFKGYDDNGLVFYECEKCGRESYWNFDLPVPVLLKQYDA